VAVLCSRARRVYLSGLGGPRSSRLQPGWEHSNQGLPKLSSGVLVGRQACNFR
jgi:hypothetical protein